MRKKPWNLVLFDALTLFVSFNAQKIGYLDWHRFYLLVNLSTMSKRIKHIQYSISLSISFENKLKSGVHDLRANFTMFVTFLVKGFNIQLLVLTTAVCHFLSKLFLNLW